MTVYNTNPRIKNTKKHGDLVAENLIGKNLSPQPILSIMNSLDTLQKAWPALLPDEQHVSDTTEAGHIKQTYNKYPTEIAAQNTAISDKKRHESVKDLPEHKLALDPHMLTGGTRNITKPYKVSEEALVDIQNSMEGTTMKKSDEIMKTGAKNKFAVATVQAEKEGYEDFSEGSEGRKRRDEIAESIKEKEGIRKQLLDKIEKQIASIEGYLIQKGVVEELPQEKGRERKRLVETAEEGGEAEEVVGDPTKAKTTVMEPQNKTETN